MGVKNFLSEAKFYIDSMYENNGYAYNMPKTFFRVGVGIGAREGILLGGRKNLP